MHVQYMQMQYYVYMFAFFIFKLNQVQLAEGP